MRIDQITTLNRDLAFRSDVKLSHYRSRENAQLVKNYQFSARSAGNYTSTAELVELLCRAATDRSENRFIFQATYGKGKSHFALALANFFGKASDEPETQTILSNIQHVSSDASKVGSLKSFKTYRKPFLMVLMDGVGPGSLRDKFFGALDEALQDSPATAGATPPFWFGEALKFLTNLRAEDVARAEAFLEPRRLELELVRESVAKHESRYYELCHELFRHLYGSRPDFGSETSLSEALNWAAQELCGDDKPFGGVLVLFDEFSLFVQDYGRQPGGALQDLLNGIEANRGKVLFIAFTQQEPETMVRDDGSSGIQSLHKELNRIPKNNRFTLQASLEDVLREFFKEDDAVWYDFLQKSGMASQVSEANDAAFEAFKIYYQRGLGWSSEKFQEAITKECFPLHPFTTVLLSNVQFGQAATTRSVIGFLTDPGGEVGLKMEQEAVIDGQLNWVLPISLVDYFKDMLDEDVWAQYQGVKAPDLSDAQSAVLKAMVLQRAGEIQTKNLGPQGFEIVIGQLAGLSRQESKEALTALENGRYIRRDEANRSYAFWAGSNGAVELERLLTKEMDARRRQQDTQGRNKLTFVVDDITENTTKATKLLADHGLVGKYPVSVRWGNQEDWAADEIILSRAGFNQRNLQHLLGACRASANTPIERRGAVIVLLAENQNDISFYESELEQILNSTADLKSAPFVVMQPKEPDPIFYSSLIKYVTLSDTFFASQVKTTPGIGQQIYEEELKRLRGQVEKGLVGLKASATLTTTQDARGRVRAISGESTQKSKIRIDNALKELYTITYHKAPESFFDQYNQSSRHLRNAIVDLVPVLESNNVLNSLAFFKTLKNNGQAKVAIEIIEKFLTNSWGIVERQQQLQTPSAPRVRMAWDYLDSAFQQGDTVQIDVAMSALLNAPFGYDHYTFTLLFASWYGYNRREIEIIFLGRAVTLEYLTKQGKGKFTDYLAALSSSRLRRRKEGERTERVKVSIGRIETGGLSPLQMEEVVSLLLDFQTKNSGNQSRLMTDLDAALEKASGASSALATYEKLARDIETGVQRARTIGSFVSQLKQVDQLPTLFTVISTYPTSDEIRANVMTRLKTFVQMESEKNERLLRGTDYGLNQNNLVQLKKELERLNLSGLATRVDEALVSLDEAKASLDAKSAEEQVLGEIRQLQSRGSSMVALKATRDKLQRYADTGTEKAKGEAQEKLTLVEDELKNLQNFVVGLTSEVDKVSSAKAARTLGEKILARRYRYEGSSDLPYLDEDRERLSRLEDAFSELERPANLTTAAAIAERQAALGALESLSDEVKAKIAAKVDELSAQLTQKQTALADSLAGLNAAPNFKAVEQSEARLREAQGFFDGTERTAEVGAGLTKAMALKQFFGELQKVDAAPRTTPYEYAARKQTLEEIMGRYREQLGDAQVSAVRQRLSKLASDLEDKQDNARGWLSKHKNTLRGAADASTLIRIQRELRHIPAFLPEPLKPEVDALHSEIETRLEGLELEAIEGRFKHLSVTQRALCLQRLKRLMHELEAV